MNFRVIYQLPYSVTTKSQTLNKDIIRLYRDKYSDKGLQFMPQGLVDNNVGSDRLAGQIVLKPNYSR